MNSTLRIDNTCATPGCHAPRDRWLTLELLISLPLLTAAMKLFGFRRTYAALGRATAGRVQRAARRHGAESNARSTPGQLVAHHIGAVVVHVNRHVLPYQSKCLQESTALWYLLRRRGYPAELLVGVRTLLGPLEAHAWVELESAVLNHAANVRDIYEPFEVHGATAKPESR